MRKPYRVEAGRSGILPFLKPLTSRNTEKVEEVEVVELLRGTGVGRRDRERETQCQIGPSLQKVLPLLPLLPFL